MLSPERNFFHEVVIKQFRELLAKDALVYDIGKGTHNYQEFLTEQKVLTIDNNPKVRPDIVEDVEGTYGRSLLGRADGVICIGVTEQCKNPFELIKGVYYLTKWGGFVLFGVMSIGYPDNDVDYFRFTPQGIIRELDKYFYIIDKQIVYRKEIPSYVFIIGKAKDADC